MGVIKCNVCGNNVDDSQNFCGKCGNNVKIVPQGQAQNRNVNNQRPPQQKQSSSVPYVILSLIILFLIGVFLEGGKIDKEKAADETTSTEITAEATATPKPTVAPTETPAVGTSTETEEITMDDIKDFFKSEDDKMSREDYISLCNKLDYNDILRNPDNYKSEYATVTGKVSQVVEGLFSTTIYISDSAGNIWGCTYSYSDGESRILENDKITIYGKCYGTQSTTTVVGKQVTMPYIDIKYYK